MFFLGGHSDLQKLKSRRYIVDSRRILSFKTNGDGTFGTDCKLYDDPMFAFNPTAEPETPYFPRTRSATMPLMERSTEV